MGELLPVRLQGDTSTAYRIHCDLDTSRRGTMSMRSNCSRKSRGKELQELCKNLSILKACAAGGF